MQIKQFTAKFTIENQEVVFPDVAMENGTFEKDGFTFQIEKNEYVKFELFQNNGKSFELTSVVYDIAFPLTNAGKIIVPDTGRHFMDTIYPRQVMFKHEFLVSSAHMSTPFFAYLDNLEKVTLAFGLMGDIIDTSFKQTSPAANKKYSLVVYDDECRWQIKKPYHDNSILGIRETFEDGFYQSEGDKTWYHALCDYASLFQKVHNVKLKTSERNYKPQLCTWRVVNSDMLTHEWSVETAKACGEVGIGSLILDDGWYGVGLDSDIMYSDIGNWPREVKDKYPDIVKTIKEIKNHGVHPLLWYCPTGVGPSSELYDQAKDFCIVNDDKLYQTPGLFHTLCPRNPQAREIIRATLQKVLSYNPDGFKPDLFNYMPISPCEADHEHDIPTILEATRVCFKMMYEEALKHNPEAIFMLKNDEANVDFSQFAPAVRSGDSPYDPNIMFLRCVYPNAFSKIVINDYLMLAGPETEEEIARCMIKQLTVGVPALSVDLLTIPEAQKDVLKAWLKLYNSALVSIHKAARIEPQNSALSCWQRIDKKKNVGMLSLIHPADMIEEMPAVDHLYILNATAHEEIFIRKNKYQKQALVKGFNFKHEKVEEYEWDSSSSLRIPPSGYCEICAATGK